MTNKEREAYGELPVIEKYEHEEEFCEDLQKWAVRNYHTIRHMLAKSAGDYHD